MERCHRSELLRGSYRGNCSSFQPETRIRLPPPSHEKNMCAYDVCLMVRHFLLRGTVSGLAGAFVLLVAPAEAGKQFRDITEQAGLTHVQREKLEVKEWFAETITGGAAVGDFFGNGRNDLFVTRHDNTDIFYMNMGDGTFEDRTKEVFGENPINAETNGALLADLTNNGHLDLYVTGTGTSRHYLYINDGKGRLFEQARPRGAALETGEVRAGMSVTAGDFTGNGYLDLFISDFTAGNSRNRLLRNRGSQAPGFFEDVTEAAGVGGPRSQWGFGARFADMNRNGLLDLLPYNDLINNQFFWNQGDGTFRESSDETGTTVGDHEMGISVADFNNNGWLDVFLTDIGFNILYRNEMHQNVSGLYFTERASQAGVGKADWGWGAATIDYDNDGWRDLVMVNGWLTREPVHLYHNTGVPEIAFTRTDQEAGLTERFYGRGVIAADFTGNGWQDILILAHAGRPALYENRGGENDWLRINLEGRVSNRQGIGAWITVTPDLENPDSRYVHEVNLEANFLSHNETTAHFGLNRMEGRPVEHVHIRWPSGIEQDVYDLEPNQVYTIVEPAIFPERELFEASASVAGLNGFDAEPNAIPFDEGVENLLKYAFNMDLSRADRRTLTPGGGEVSGLPCVAISESRSNRLLVIEFLRRKDSGLIYTPFWSTDLETWIPAAALPQVIEINSEWERAIVRVPFDFSAPRGYGLVRVALP